MIKPTKRAFIALDTAYQHGVVTLFTETELLFAQTLTTKYAHGQQLGPAIQQAVQVADEQGVHIVGMFSGLGPGSFVGVRLALAFALGFSCARGIPLMGFCSHRALALSLANKHPELMVAMKASGQLYYVSRYSVQDAQLSAISPIVVLPLEEIVAHNKQEVIGTDQDEALMALSKKSAVLNLLGPSSEGVFKAAQEVLAGGLIDQSSLIKPNYIKPPSVSLPKKIIPRAG